MNTGIFNIVFTVGLVSVFNITCAALSEFFTVSPLITMGLISTTLCRSLDLFHKQRLVIIRLNTILNLTIFLTFKGWGPGISPGYYMCERDPWLL